MTSRRSFLLGVAAALATPAIVRAEVLMQVRTIIMPRPMNYFVDCENNPYFPLAFRTIEQALNAAKSDLDSGVASDAIVHLSAGVHRVSRMPGLSSFIPIDGKITVQVTIKNDTSVSRIKFE